MLQNDGRLENDGNAVTRPSLLWGVLEVFAVPDRSRQLREVFMGRCPTEVFRQHIPGGKGGGEARRLIPLFCALKFCSPFDPILWLLISRAPPPRQSERASILSNRGGGQCFAAPTHCGETWLTLWEASWPRGMSSARSTTSPPSQVQPSPTHRGGRSLDGVSSAMSNSNLLTWEPMSFLRSSGSQPATVRVASSLCNDTSMHRLCLKTRGVWVTVALLATFSCVRYCPVFVVMYRKLMCKKHSFVLYKQFEYIYPFFSCYLLLQFCGTIIFVTLSLESHWETPCFFVNTVNTVKTVNKTVLLQVS